MLPAGHAVILGQGKAGFPETGDPAIGCKLHLLQRSIQHRRDDAAVYVLPGYVVYLPEDYDGLVFAAQAQPDNYADAMALDNLENVSPEGNIMDLAPLDPYASLYFSICG